MATFSRFEEILAWQSARSLAREIYRITAKGSFSKDYGLRDQIRRASVSGMSNIAEGFERSGKKEFIQFLAMAKGSVGEVRSQLYVALDAAYLDPEAFERLMNLATETACRISGLMSCLRGSTMTGTKYKGTRALKSGT